ncbi:MAG: DUF5106 domain-containing protein, partial [Muribaculaceae bacterium]|nr:DUF5106 domain-containing protein [Muribaculaceae bacterium]
LRNLFISISMILSGMCIATAQDTYFPYPSAPDNLPSFRARANYLVEHFWDRCNFNNAFSSKAKMAIAFDDFAGFMPHAAADTVHMAIDKLIATVKKRPADLLTLTEMAEGTFYADTARFWSDELYLPFAKAAATSKKIPAEQRNKYASQVQLLEHSQTGMTVPGLQATLRDGTQWTLDSLISPVSVILFDSPGCLDCAMTRARLAANISAQRLIDAGVLKIAYIHIGPASDEWKAQVANLPQSWVVAACPEADKYFDMRVIPAIYMLDENRTILAKHISLNDMIQRFENVITQVRNQQQ